MTARDASAAWQRLAIWGSVLRVISWPVVVRGAGAAAGGAFERCSNAHAQQLKNMMQPAEIQLISQLINQTGASSYFEWGTGGSTDSFPRALPRGGRAVAVENFPAWCSRVRAAPFASCAIAAGALEYRCLAPENETVGGAGYPAAWLRNHSDAASTRAFGSYIDAIGKDAPPGGWDAVLVDGRFRVACLLEALHRDVLGNQTGERVHDSAVANLTVILCAGEPLEGVDLHNRLHEQLRPDLVSVAGAREDRKARRRTRHGVIDLDESLLAHKAELDPVLASR